MLTVLISNQKTYGKQYSVADTFIFWKMKLENKFSANDILLAVDAYTDYKDDIPTPADIIKILRPEEKQIAYAEYKHAKEQHALEGFPQFGYYGQIIKDYHAQGNDQGSIKSHQQILEARKQHTMPKAVADILKLTYGVNHE
jgi:hypothetical protein